MSVKKAIVGFFATLLLLISLTLIGLVIYLYVSANDVFASVDNVGLVLFIILIVICSILFFNSICGLCGVCRQNNCCLITFIVMMVIWFLLFLGVGISAAVLPPKVIGDSCISTDTFQKLQDYAQASQLSLCVTCQCYFPKRNDNSIYPYSNLTMQAQLNISAPLYTTTNSSAAVMAQSCPGWDSSTFKDGNKVYQYFEKYLKCTGWCSNTTSLFYRFTNVNNGIPEDTCYNAMSNAVKKYFRIICIIDFVVAGLILVTVIVAACLTCDIRNSQSNYKQANTYGTEREMANAAAPPYQGNQAYQGYKV